MTIKFFLNSILNSYAQIFFSQNKVLAVVVLLVTFISPFLGACGLACIVLVNGLAVLFRLDKTAIAQGSYSFNALLLGLALGHEYQFNLAFCVLFLVAALLLLLLTVWLSHQLGNYGLPFLALPFLFTYWLVYLSAGAFEYVLLQEEMIFVENYKAKVSSSFVYWLAHSLDNLPLHELLSSYFKTLASTFFQNSVLAGLLISLGLLYFSRIAFSLSLLGFYLAVLTFKLLGMPMIWLTDYLVGSNFIFLAIAVGGFFLIPSRWSYGFVVLLVPILCVFMVSINQILAVFQLKSFTLSFTLLTHLFLFFAHHYKWHNTIQLVSLQYYSPEKTIYKHLSTTLRFKNINLARFALPFWGEWTVSQAYDGEITHLGEWSKALDFVITEDGHTTFQNYGTELQDFYCYNKPVLAPHDGYVYDIVNTVEENPINSVDTQKNWGNTIILNHQNGLFSQLSHLKKDSIRVKIGDYVYKGAMLATCGNSGRSPEPHIHFQLQLSPRIGEKTYPYPLAYYLKRKNKEQNHEQVGEQVSKQNKGQQNGQAPSWELKTFEVPQKNDRISNVEVSPLLVAAYDWQPSRRLRLTNKANPAEIWEWTVYTDAYNRSYFYCPKSKATLWFANDGTMFYCYDYEGDTNSLLFDFYLANYKILLACYTNLEVQDTVPLHFLRPWALAGLQDFAAPFFLFSTNAYTSAVQKVDAAFNPKQVALKTFVTNKIGKTTHLQRNYALHFEENSLKEWVINEKTTFLCEYLY